MLFITRLLSYYRVLVTEWARCWYGLLDGRNSTSRRRGVGPKNPEYVYVPHTDSKPYFDMAHEWLLAYHMHQSHLDESFAPHQALLLATGAIERRPAVWGVALRRRQERHWCRPSPSSARTANRMLPASTDKTSGVELDVAGFRGAFTRAKSIETAESGRAIRLPAISVAAPIGRRT